MYARKADLLLEWTGAAVGKTWLLLQGRRKKAKKEEEASIKSGKEKWARPTKVSSKLDLGGPSGQYYTLAKNSSKK